MTPVWILVQHCTYPTLYCSRKSTFGTVLVPVCATTSARPLHCRLLAFI